MSDSPMILNYRQTFTGGRSGITDVTLDGRPLVVIDPEDREQVERLAAEFKPCKAGNSCVREHCAGDRMQDALHQFANPKPPEPIGKWAVIEDAGGRCLIRSAFANDCPWNVLGTGDYLDYDDIAAVRVLSEGVQQP